MTKSECIANKWIEKVGDKKFGEIFNFIDKDGWIFRKVTGHGETNGFEYEEFGFTFDEIDIRSEQPGNYHWRPKTLRGIESNNGWTKIESRDNYLGFSSNIKFDLGVMNINGDFKVVRREVGLNTLIRGYYHSGITHFRKTEDTKPIY